VIDPAVFRSTVGHFPTGVAIVTAAGAGGPFGMTVATFCSISLDPVLVGFFAGRSSSTWPAIERCGHFAVNVLSHDQAQLGTRFASTAGDRFAGVECSAAVTGAPILGGVHAWLDCRLHDTAVAGDHVLVMGEVQACGVDPDRQPLVFYRSSFTGVA
jgi:flavin reductase (DIM6/NTAB) family NADH-FMN oxidoreductase RutF